MKPAFFLKVRQVFALLMGVMLLASCGGPAPSATPGATGRSPLPSATSGATATALPSAIPGAPARPTRAPTRTPAPPPTPAAAQLAELAKFEQPENYLPKSGPAGTQWDGPYRALIQTSESAVSKGLPSHPEAQETIKTDAALSAANLEMHLGYVLYITHFSKAYRPQQGTDSLRQLYSDLVAIQFGQAYIPPSARPWFEDVPDLTILRNVVYGDDDPPLQNLDAYLVKSAKPAAVLVEVHGGGWRRGYKSQFEIYNGDLIGQVIDQGISVISINYRLSPNDSYPIQVMDTALAIQFIRSKAQEWNIDPGRIAALGGSAGAHLSAWVGLHDDLAKPAAAEPLARFSTRLSCFVDFSGPMDLAREDPLQMAGPRGSDFGQAYANFIGTIPEWYNRTPETQALIKDASPVTWVSADDPPALIIANGPENLSGKDHPPVPAKINDPHSAWHGVLLADALEAAGVAVVRRIGPQVGKDPAADNKVVIDFLNGCLK